MPSPRPLRLPAPLVASGFALVVPAAIGPEVLADGGLAPLAVAVVVAAALGAPLARVEASAPREGSDPLDAARRSLGDLWSVLLIGAVAAPWVRSAGAAGLSLAAAVWLAAALGARAGARSVVFVGAAAGLVALTAAIAGLATAPPWTLLEPGWSDWRAWAPRAGLWGVLLAGAGLGQWREGVPPAPGGLRAVWAVPGAALAVALLVTVRAGSWFEAGGGVDPLGNAAAALALVAAGCALLEREAPRAHPFRAAVAGVLATAWFAGPAWGVLPLWWGSLAMIGPAAWLALLALRASGSHRAPGALGAAVLAAAALVGWPGAPTTAAAAAAAAATVVLAVWVVGTRALAGRPA